MERKKSNERLWSFNLNNSIPHLVASHDMHFATYNFGKKTNDSTYFYYHGEGNLQQPSSLTQVEETSKNRLCETLKQVNMGNNLNEEGS